MHTFFINTSGTEFVDLPKIFDIEIETRKLIALDCPVSDWDSPDRGYKACSDQIGRMIDNFRNVDNDFNMVFYVDLLEFAHFSTISDSLSDKENKRACIIAFFSLFKRYFRDTLIKQLKKEGRSPREILLIFEHNGDMDDFNAGDEALKNDIRRHVAILLGLPAEDDALPVKQYLIPGDTAGDSHASADAFISRFDNTGSAPFKCGILRFLKNETDVFIHSLAEAPHPSDAFEGLYKSFLDRAWNPRNEDDVDHGDVKLSDILVAPFSTDRTASSVNRKENARRNLRLYLFLAERIQKGWLSGEAKPGAEEKKKVVFRDFSDDDWKKVEGGLESLRLGYSKLLGEVKSGTVDFTNPELHLVPRLRSLDKSRYGLRDDGGPDAILEFEEADEDPDVTGTAEVPTDDSISVEIPKAVKKPAERTPVIEESVFPDFDYLGLEKATDGKGGEITRKTSCEEMKSAAQKLHTHHVEYLQRLNHHIESELSSYMGQSDENGEAVIKKRRVSIGTDAADGADYYTSYFTDGEKKEERIETVRSFSGKAYETMLSEYLNAFAARKVGLTDITSNIEKFNHKINGISEALRKKTAVLAGTAVFLLLLLIPFFVIGADTFFDRITNAAFWISLSVPVLLLIAAFLFAIRKLKDKYFHTWLVFQDESNKALTSNARAARELDELLKLHLPSLKQVYEYQLDVEFYYECCKLAKSKLAHHKNKLSERIQLIKLVLEDLEFSNDVGKAGITPFDCKMPELMLAFCAGDNPQIYAVLDKKILDLLNKKDGGVK